MINHICDMTNYDRKTHSKAYDHIIQMDVSGISDDFPYYDAHKDYEINNQDYWTYFEDIDFHFSDNVT